MENKTIDKYICIVCLVSTLSQIPYVYSNGILSKIAPLSWLILSVALLFYNGLKIAKSSVLFLPIVFDLYCFVAECLSGRGYISSDLFRAVNLCTFVFIVGLLASGAFRFESLIVFAETYICGTAITSIIIYFEYCFGNEITGDGYLYNAKNSFASILLVAMIFTVVLREYIFNTVMKKVFMVLLTTFDIYFLFILKSRTTLVCFFVLLIWFIVSRNTKWSVKITLIIVISIVCWCIYNDESLYDMIVNTILLNGKDSTNLNDITSNRMRHLEVFQKLFPGNEVIGIGGYYLESFPLTALLSFGWLGSMWIFVFALSPIFSAIKGLYCKHKDKIFTLILLAISISLIVNGIAEEQPPFGPGIKCFAMWFLFGIYCGQSNYVNLREKNTDVKSIDSNILLHK